MSDLLSKHRKLIELHDQASKLADHAIEVRRSKRKDIDEFVKLHGDVIGKHNAMMKRDEFANRTIPEKSLEDIEWFENLKKKNNETLNNWNGIFWDTVEKGVPIPFPIIFKISDFHEKASMADVLVKIGLFPSLTEARKAGHKQPIKTGEFRFRNGKFGIKRIIIEE